MGSNPDTLTIIAATADATRAIGERLGRLLASGDIVLLRGNLGAGKTTLAQGVGIGLGVTPLVTSPTFTLMHEHRGGRLPLIHVDPYRLPSEDDLYGIGMDEWLESGAAVLVEWPERLGSLEPEDRLLIEIATMPDESRRLTLSASGPASRRLLSGMAEGEVD